jgi:hypothetical protein
MKRVLGIILLLTSGMLVMAQGSGFGYIAEIGGSGYCQSGSGYNQSYYTVTHNGFIRFHSESGHSAFQLMVGFRTDTISFRNNTEYMSADGFTIMRYNSDAFLKRDALKLTALNQWQIGRPGRVVLAFNAGLYYEHTLRAVRQGYNDSYTYYLDNEIHYDNFGYTVGCEFRLLCFTVGYKYEQLFTDLLNHDYVLSLQPASGNSSELRGLVLNPPMHFIYLGINIDFYDRHKCCK